MTKKKFIKQLMAKGWSRNQAQAAVNLVAIVNGAWWRYSDGN